ncbi:uncharacterized protein LOC110678927 [Aedes aegypti]|uniref:Uncharacterized protein n=1 Tax=Aedes aegypti TaxID=7159 RepID=A0A6I8U9W1_AEDAE|nr:uncharacterized protein LOC110678927 [Aedes aegypti]
MSHPPYDSQQSSSGTTMPMTTHYHPQQQQQVHHRAEVEYFYVYVAESELSNVGNWILLEPDKTLSLKNLREYYSTCFGIKHKLLNAKNEMEVRYIRYHNGYFRFPPGLDLNNTRFVAYYYSDLDDIRAFMEMAEANDKDQARVGMPVTTLATSQPPPQPEGHNDTTLMGRTSVFEMDSILRSGAQSTPVKGSISRQMPTTENVSSTSDVILNEPPVEVISVQDSQDTLRLSLPPPPPGPPKPVTKDNHNLKPCVPSTNPAPSGIRAKLGPSVSSTSEVKQIKPLERPKHERITINDSSGFQRDRSSVMVKVNTAPKSRNMLDRYQQNRPAPEDVNSKTPLKVTLKTRGRQVQPHKEILKIEDARGRTTALLTKKKWSAKPEVGHQKRRSEPDDEPDDRHQKRRRYDHQYQNYQQVDPKPSSSHRVLNVLLVGFHDQAPVIHETTSYFSEFGTVTNFQLYTQENRFNVPEYYAYMEIRAGDSISLFSDRHVYNGTIIYAIRVDGSQLPSRLTCRVCGYYGLNVAHLAYHVEGQYHQQTLRKRLQSQATTHGQHVYLDSYYRITYDELYVQYPTNPVQEMVRNDYWKRSYQPATHSSDAAGSGKRYYTTSDKERFY